MVGGVLVCAFFGMLGIFLVRTSVAMWRDGRNSVEAFSSLALRMSRTGRKLHYGLIRGWIPFTFGMVCLAVAMPFVIVVDSNGSAKRGASLPVVIAIILIALFCCGMILQFYVALFARPKWCIPPSMRNEVGILHRGSLDHHN